MARIAQRLDGFDNEGYLALSTSLRPEQFVGSPQRVVEMIGLPATASPAEAERRPAAPDPDPDRLTIAVA